MKILNLFICLLLFACSTSPKKIEETAKVKPQGKAKPKLEVPQEITKQYYDLKKIKKLEKGTWAYADVLKERARIFEDKMRDLTFDRSSNKSMRFMSGNKEFYQYTLEALKPLKELTGEKKEYQTFLDAVKAALKLESPERFQNRMEFWTQGLSNGLISEAQQEASRP